VLGRSENCLFKGKTLGTLGAVLMKSDWCKISVQLDIDIVKPLSSAPYLFEADGTGPSFGRIHVLDEGLASFWDFEV